MSGKKGSKTPQYQTVTNETKLPAWVDSAGQSNVAMANDVAANLLPVYGGNTVAPLNGTQQQGWDMAIRNADAAQGDLASAGRSLEGVAGRAAPSFLSKNIDGYLNPFLNGVVETSLRDLDDVRKRSLIEASDKSLLGGGGFGSRLGVVEGVTNAESAKAAGSLGAQLRSAAYDRAAGLLSSDLDRELQQEGLSTNAALGLGSIGTAKQNAALQGAGVVEGIGDKQRGYEQSLLDADRAKYEAQRQMPIDQLNIRLAALGATPYGKTQTTTGPSNQQQANPFLGALGGAATGASIASNLGLTSALGGFGGPAGAGLGALLGILSDENEKTDIERVGTDPKTGLPLYAFRYKDDPKTYPKVVGIMAQDVEKAYPDGVAKIGGRRVVKRSFLSAV